MQSTPLSAPKLDMNLKVMLETILGCVEWKEEHPEEREPIGKLNNLRKKGYFSLNGMLGFGTIGSFQNQKKPHSNKEERERPLSQDIYLPDDHSYQQN